MTSISDSLKMDAWKVGQGETSGGTIPFRCQTVTSHHEKMLRIWSTYHLVRWLTLMASWRTWPRRAIFMVRKISCIIMYERWTSKENIGKPRCTPTQPKTRLTDKRFEPTGPHVFRIGDIVEVQMSFIVVPLKGKLLKMRTVLHSIALLNGQLTKVSSRICIKTQLAYTKITGCRGPAPKECAKRKSGDNHQTTDRIWIRGQQQISRGRHGRNRELIGK
jgi:hypothetical protein